MLAPKVHPSPEELHPSIWRASQLARASTRCVDTGYPALSRELPDGGWPTGTAVDLMPQQCGVGEMRLLAPALKKVAHKRIILLQPPHSPQIIALAGLGLQPSQLIWVKSATNADALWSAEQVLKTNCGALLFWNAHLRPESLRRLHLAAQSGSTLFFAMRPLAAAQDSSPAPLRLGLRPAPGGISVEFVKRRGPQREEPLFLPLPGFGQRVPSRHLEVPARVAVPSTPLPADLPAPARREVVDH